MEGRIIVNGAKTTADRKLMLGDVVGHQMHVHESPVARDLPQIIATTDDLVVINKPAGMPVRTPCNDSIKSACHSSYLLFFSSLKVHPVASYRHNTLTRILINEMNAPRIACKFKCYKEKDRTR